jgi:hypothetical protein
VAVIDGRIAMLDFVGRADVYAALQPAIVEGYALHGQRDRGLGADRRGGELVQMTAFPSDADEPRPGPDGGPTPAPSRINRPPAGEVAERCGS